MIKGVHAMFYTPKAEEVRAFQLSFSCEDNPWPHSSSGDCHLSEWLGK